MVEQKQLCPAYGCTVVGGGYEKEGVEYCCEPCASGGSSACECGCCHIVEESDREK